MYRRSPLRHVLSLGAVVSLLLAGPAHASVVGHWSFDEPFDGVGDYYDTELNLDQLDGSFTAEAIARYDGAADRTWTPLLGSSHGPSFDPDEIFFIGKHDGNNDLNINIGGLEPFSFSSGGFFDGDLHLLAVVYDQAQSEIRAYVDDQLIHTESGISGSVAGSSVLRIGGTGHAVNERWPGLINEVRFSTEVLGPGQFIPEPGTLGILALGALALMRRRRRP